MPDKVAYYGANPFKIFLQNWRDKRDGKGHRANARKGFLSPPEGRGKVVWIRAGHSEQSVLLASEILAAIRNKRQDVRLILTYEEEYPEILAPRLKGLEKIGFGFGPADSKTAIKRVLKRFQPLGTILVDELPGANLLKSLGDDESIRKVAFQLAGNANVSWQFDSCLPASDSAQLDCKQAYSAQDVMSILVNPQVEPSFGGLIRQDSELPLWCVLGVQKAAVYNLLQSIAETELFPSAYLCLSFSDKGAEQQAMAGLQKQGRKVCRLSEWDRQTLEPGSVVLIDDPKWIAAAAASATAIHLQQPDRYTYWQVMASGKPTSIASDYSWVKNSVFENKLPKYKLFSEVEQYWRELLDAPFQARQAGDQLRNAFWQARRAASANIEDFLERVFNW